MPTWKSAVHNSLRKGRLVTKAGCCTHTKHTVWCRRSLCFRVCKDRTKLGTCVPWRHAKLKQNRDALSGSTLICAREAKHGRSYRRHERPAWAKLQKASPSTGEYNGHAEAGGQRGSGPNTILHGTSGTNVQRTMHDTWMWQAKPQACWCDAMHHQCPFNDVRSRVRACHCRLR